jgi:ABC-type nitrate/sulfonate/bicarbonate transport system substrate-binding protein
MEEVHLAYRTESFSPFVHTVREIGREQYNLNVEMTLIRGVEDAERDLVGGEIDLIIGQHYTPFVSKITGKHLTWLAVAQNRRDYKLVTRPGIRNLSELRGKSVARAKNYCLGINQQIVLNRMGLEGEVTEVLDENRGTRAMLDLLEQGDVDGAFVDVPGDIEAKRRGFVVHDETPALDIVAGECITTVPRFTVEKDAALRAFMKAYLHAVSIFTRKPDYVTQLIRNNPRIVNDLNNRFKAGDEELLKRFISHWSSRWEKKPYPNLKAMANTHEKAIRYDPRCAAVNPLTVIDMHYVKELDESGFIDKLYQ